MAIVKRYRIRFDIRKSPDEPPGPDFNDFVLASDYDKLVEVVRGFLACNHSCTCMRDNQCDFCLMRSRALALIGEGGEEVNENPKELWLNYINNGLCGLCGNTGFIDTRGRAISSAGVDCGVLRNCICPNGGTIAK